MHNKVREPLFHIVKRDALPWYRAWGIRALAIVLALLLCALITTLCTHLNPLKVFATMFSGAFGTPRKMWILGQNLAILLCISLAVTPAFKMRFWNIGAEGQVLAGGLAAAACMICLGDKVPNGLLIVLIVIAGIAAGAVWAGIPAIFKAKWNTNETLFTLMMNYVATQIVAYFIIIWESPKGSGQVGIINQSTEIGWLPRIGGNQYLQNQTGCKIYAPGIECDLTRHPLLEPAFLYGGYPPKDLRHKFLMAKPSDAQELTAACLPEGFGLLPLPGHFFDMVGFRTPDDVVYLADCLSSRETLEKYQIGFLYDVAAYLNTLETVKALRARAFVPAHAAVTEDIVPLAQYNIDKVLEIADIITELCRTPQTFESVLQQLFRRFDLVMDFEQYALVGSTVRSYLAWGKDTGRLQVIFDDHRLLWQQA